MSLYDILAEKNKRIAELEAQLHRADQCVTRFEKCYIETGVGKEQLPDLLKSEELAARVAELEKLVDAANEQAQTWFKLYGFEQDERIKLQKQVLELRNTHS